MKSTISKREEITAQVAKYLKFYSVSAAVAAL